MGGKYFASHFDIIFEILGQLILLEWIRKRAAKLLELLILCVTLSLCVGTVEYGEMGLVCFIGQGNELGCVFPR